MTHKNSIKCCLCESEDIEATSYLNYRGGKFSRNIGYMLPESLSNLLSEISPKFAQLYHSVKINKKYYSRKAIYCNKCHTGYVSPQFAEEELDEYYREFYWSNRARHDASQDTADHIPHTLNINLSRERVAWIKLNGGAISSVIYFGAGDCAAAYTLRTDFGVKNIFIVDKSTRSRDIAKIMGMNYYDSMSAAPPVDLVHSAHSIEHVHDLKNSFQLIVSKVNDGGYIFFDTPNIANLEIFEVMPHTPHTYMLSIDSIM